MKIAATRTIIVFISLIFISLMLTGQSYAKFELKSAAAIWLFDEGKGDVAKDFTGNGSDGKLTGGASWDNGKYGKALKLDGAASWVKVEATDVFALQDFTITFFVKPGAQDEAIVSLIDYSHTPANWVVQTEQGMGSKMWYMGYWGKAVAGWQVDAAGNVAFTEGVWQHIAFVKTGKEMLSYKDGVLANTRKNADAEVGYTVTPLNFGAWQGTSRFFNGLLDDVMIYKGVLTEAEIKNIAAKGIINGAAVLPSGKLSVAWGELKSQ